MNTIIRFFKEEDGASLIEYVLLAALIGVAAIGAMTAVGTESTNTLQGAANAMQLKTASVVHIAFMWTTEENTMSIKK